MPDIVIVPVFKLLDDQLCVKEHKPTEQEQSTVQLELQTNTHTHSKQRHRKFKCMHECLYSYQALIQCMFLHTFTNQSLQSKEWVWEAHSNMI